jgi:hypothetical protein
VVSLGNEYNVKVQAVSTGFVDKGYDFGSSKIHSVKAPVIGLVTGEGISSNAAGEVWHFFEREIDYPVTLINLNNNFSNNLKDFDVLILPDGNYSLLSGKSQAAQLKEWINSGGKLVAMEGAAAAIAKLHWGFRLKNGTDTLKEDATNPYQYLRKFENRERDMIRNLTPGSIFKVELDNTHPLAFGYPPFYYTLKQDDRIYEYIEEDGWNVGIIKKQNQVAGFVGYELKERLKDGLLFGVVEIGRGSIVVLSENPLFRDFWENGKLLFSNAIFMVGR